MTPTTTTHTARQVGEALVTHCRQGKNQEAMDALYHNDIVSVEAMAMPGSPSSRETKGVEACKKKGQMWQSMNEVHSATIEGPFMHGEDRFAIYFSYDITPKATGKRMHMMEVGVYWVKDGKVTREEFYYTM